jgi:hypothetical protein
MITLFSSAPTLLIAGGAALALLNAAPSMLLAGGRAAEALSYHFSARMHPARRNLNRTTDYAHRAGATIAPVLEAMAWRPGILLFLIGLFEATDLFSVTPTLVNTGTLPQKSLLLAALSIALIAILFKALLAGPGKAWGSRAGSILISVLRWLTRGALVATVTLSAPDIHTGLWLCAGLLFVEASALLLWHGYFHYHLHMWIWLPFAALALLSQIAATSILGPIAWMLPRIFKDGALPGPIGSGVSRKAKINRATEQVSYRHAVDTIEGMQRPV